MDHLKNARRLDATILFCDIRGFTALFDERDPLEALAFANVILGELGAVVEACQGTLDKFTGDGFLAYFTNGTDGEQARAAILCAIRMRSKLTQLNLKRYLTDQPVIAIGVGIHSGTVALGVIDTGNKQEQTIIGSNVNIAARIESLTKLFSVDCLMTSATRDLLDDSFLLQKMPAQKVRGVNAIMQTYWLLPMNAWP